eukprot:GHVL01041554.1.p1 GENE.GHVL01041554.1~~GHVL01041554.1.p1  ORF type:complete len:1097 (+),score=209.39 GHVL01041554.1:386-3292(+)
MDKYIKELSIEYEGITIDNAYEEICDRNHNDECNSQSILSMYGNDPNVFMVHPLAIYEGMIWTPSLDNAFIYDVLISNPKTEKQMIPLPPGSAPSGMTILTEMDVVIGTEALMFLYNVKGVEAEKAAIWEEVFIKEMLEYVKTMNSLKVSFNAFTSRDIELAASTGQDTIFIILTFFILVTYAACLNYSFDLAKSKVYPALGGTSAACLGFVAGIGLCCWFGLPWVTTAMVTPFLCMGIGLDDMFVMVNSYTLAYMVERPKDRCAVCLRDCGLSITMTTTTNLLAFAVGAASPYSSIKNFCVFTGLSLFFGYIMALTFFFGILCIDAKREAENRICCRLRNPKSKKKKSYKTSPFPQGAHSSGNGENIRGSQLSAASLSTFSLVSFKARAVADRNRLRYTKKNALPSTSEVVPSTVIPAASPTQRMERGDEMKGFESDEFWEEPRGTVGRQWRMFFLYYYGQWLTHPVTKICVILFFIAFVAVSYNGFTKLPQGLELRQLAADTSYLQSFEDDLAVFFSKYGPQTDVFIQEELPWWKSEYRTNLKNMAKSLETAYYGIRVINPLELFYTSSYAPESLSASGDVEETAFITGLTNFLDDHRYKRFERDFSWNSSNSIVRSFRLTVLPKFYQGSKERGQFMQDMRNDVSKYPKLHATAYNYYFVFFESDLEILPSVIQNLSIAAVCMLFVALILIPKLQSGLLVVLTMAMIDVGLFGFMYYWDLQLNMITMINLVISIGFSVDYSAHICHTFTHCEGETRNLRAIEALVLMGTPVLHGAMSTQIGVVMLSLSGSYLFRVFFRMMTMVLVFGVSHGIIFLPVMLSLVGPMPKNAKKPNTEGDAEKTCSLPGPNIIGNSEKVVYNRADETAPPSEVGDDIPSSPGGATVSSQEISPNLIDDIEGKTVSTSRLGRVLSSEYNDETSLSTRNKRVSGSTNSMPGDRDLGAAAILDEAIRARIEGLGRKKSKNVM